MWANTTQGKTPLTQVLLVRVSQVLFLHSFLFLLCTNGRGKTASSHKNWNGNCRLVTFFFFFFFVVVVLCINVYMHFVTVWWRRFQSINWHYLTRPFDMFSDLKFFFHVQLLLFFIPFSSHEKVNYFYVTSLALPFWH